LGAFGGGEAFQGDGWIAYHLALQVVGDFDG
jgi:hypothetical protein